jgi:beta-glucosidase
MPRHPEQGLGVDTLAIGAAIAEALPGVTVTREAGCPLDDPADPAEFERAVASARDAELVIAVVGDRAGMFGRGTSGEGSDAPSLDLPGEQGRLLDALIETGTPVVVLVVSGRPYALGRFVGRATLLQAFMPGIEGASAIARVLTGAVNPSGHLPVQIPRTNAALPHTYLAPPLGQDGDRISNLSIEAAFPFGHGLSYTSFALSDVELDRDRIATDGALTARVRVVNTGERDGATVVQLYGSDPVAQVTRPVRQLVGYARVELAAGGAATVAFDLHADRFSFTGLDRRRIVEPGLIQLAAGLSVRDLTAPASFEIIGGVRVVSDPVLTTGSTVDLEETP